MQAIVAMNLVQEAIPISRSSCQRFCFFSRDRAKERTKHRLHIHLITPVFRARSTCRLGKYLALLVYSHESYTVDTGFLVLSRGIETALDSRLEI